MGKRSALRESSSTAVCERMKAHPPIDEYERITLRVKHERPEVFMRAQEEFMDFVEPAVAYMAYPDPLELEKLNALFSEWFLFDFDAGDGLSPLEEAAGESELLSQIADTQFFSHFWVMSQDAKSCVVELRDVRSGEDFSIIEPDIARQPKWAKGTIGVRLARIDDVWTPACQSFLHDNAPSKPVPAGDVRADEDRRDPHLFIDLVEKVFGNFGEYHESYERRLRKARAVARDDD